MWSARVVDVMIQQVLLLELLKSRYHVSQLHGEVGHDIKKTPSDITTIFDYTNKIFIMDTIYLLLFIVRTRRSFPRKYSEKLSILYNTRSCLSDECVILLYIDRDSVSLNDTRRACFLMRNDDIYIYI